MRPGRAGGGGVALTNGGRAAAGWLVRACKCGARMGSKKPRPMYVTTNVTDTVNIGPD